MEYLAIKKSDQINEIVAALAKAQGEMKPAVFNRVNPHFKNKYADFTSCMEACREPLSKNGIAISQIPSKDVDGKMVLVTLLAHTSGQWMAAEFPLISAKMDSQGIGSAMTYAKRYSLCGMTGVVSDEEVDIADDDGEMACGRGAAPKKAQMVEPTKMPPSSMSQFNLAMERIKETDLHNNINEWIKKKYGSTTTNNLTPKDYELLMDRISQQSKENVA